MKALVKSVCMVALFAGCGGPTGDTQPQGEVGEVELSAEELSRAGNIDYAKQVYGNYQEAAGSVITFEVASERFGRLTELVERPLQEVVSVPDYWISMESFGTEIKSVTREARLGTDDEWTSPVELSRFNELGKSTKAATYALLNVRTSLDGQVTEHKALQACWPAQSYCLVIDPVVRDLEGFAEDRARLKAQNWRVQEEEAPPAAPEGEVGIQRVCSLNSRPTAGGLSYTWGSFTRTYKNLYGVTVVQKTLGGQKIGISCYISGTYCKASGNGYSWASSCWANLGFNCDCDNTGNQTGVTGSAARAWSQTKCGHKNVLSGSTNISWSRSGVGAGFTINWGTSGSSVDSSGGTMYDACSWH
jgi:hypothetical protein